MGFHDAVDCYGFVFIHFARTSVGSSICKCLLFGTRKFCWIMLLSICPLPVPSFSTLSGMPLSWHLTFCTDPQVFFTFCFSLDLVVFLLYLLSDFLSFVIKILYWSFSYAIIFQTSSMFSFGVFIFYRNILATPSFYLYPV